MAVAPATALFLPLVPKLHLGTQLGGEVALRSRGQPDKSPRKQKPSLSVSSKALRLRNRSVPATFPKHSFEDKCVPKYNLGTSTRPRIFSTQ